VSIPTQSQLGGNHELFYRDVSSGELVGRPIECPMNLIPLLLAVVLVVPGAGVVGNSRYVGSMNEIRKLDTVILYRFALT
jgi:hypothetical protein